MRLRGRKNAPNLPQPASWRKEAKWRLTGGLDIRGRCDGYANLGATSSRTRESVHEYPETPQSPPPTSSPLREKMPVPRGFPSVTADEGRVLAQTQQRREKQSLPFAKPTTPASAPRRLPSPQPSPRREREQKTNRRQSLRRRLNAHPHTAPHPHPTPPAPAAAASPRPAASTCPGSESARCPRQAPHPPRSTPPVRHGCRAARSAR